MKTLEEFQKGNSRAGGSSQVREELRGLKKVFIRASGRTKENYYETKVLKGLPIDVLGGNILLQSFYKLDLNHVPDEDSELFKSASENPVISVLNYPNYKSTKIKFDMDLSTVTRVMYGNISVWLEELNYEPNSFDLGRMKKKKDEEEGEIFRLGSIEGRLIIPMYVFEASNPDIPVGTVVLVETHKKTLINSIQEIFESTGKRFWDTLLVIGNNPKEATMKKYYAHNGGLVRTMVAGNTLFTDDFAEHEEQLDKAISEFVGLNWHPANSVYIPKLDQIKEAFNLVGIKTGLNFTEKQIEEWNDTIKNNMSMKTDTEKQEGEENED